MMSNNESAQVKTHQLAKSGVELGELEAEFELESSDNVTPETPSCVV